MGKKKIETIIEEKITPYSLNNKGKADIARLVNEYSYNLLLECINVGIATYFRYDLNGKLTKQSVENFISKLGGIAFNKSRSPIDKEIYHLKNKGKQIFSYWDNNRAEKLLYDYVNALRNHWNEDAILADLCGETNRLMNCSKTWSQWVGNMEQWIHDIKDWDKENIMAIQHLGSILPEAVFSSVSTNVQSLCKQINASYENNLFDCTAVIMRRLLESLLVLCYQKANIESEIMDKNGCYHISLDKMIKNAQQNTTLELSANTKKDMPLFKDLGNYSAHKIWYNCTQSDIEPHILKYRVIIEELMYKSGIKV